MSLGTFDEKPIELMDDLIPQQVQFGGIGQLTDTQLIALLLDKTAVTSAYRAAELLLEKYNGDLDIIRKLTVKELTKAKGIGQRQALRIQAALELARRLPPPEENSIIISNNFDVAAIFKPLIARLPHEEVWALYLNPGNRVLEKCRISYGGQEVAPVDVKSVLRQALRQGASAIILVHNHPSGNTTPSRLDIDLTKRMRKACEWVDIPLRDHIILGGDNMFSFRAKGWMEEQSEKSIIP